MKQNVIHIKNMVCPRCIWAVENVLNSLHIDTKDVKIGEIITVKPTDELNIKKLQKHLQNLGFDIIEDHKKMIVEKIKGAVVYWIGHIIEEQRKWNFSEYLVDKLHKDYRYLSSLFSEIEDITIEKYIIQKKVEKVKELIIYDELNINEIAFNMGYSSSAHLSNQFKQITGYTPLQFKQLMKHHEI